MTNALESMEPWGSITPALDAWLSEHHSTAWKFKPYRIPKLGKAKGAGKDAAWMDAVRQWKYAVTETIDRRQIREPLELGAWIERKRALMPTWKPWKLPAGKTVLTALTAAQRATEAHNVSDCIRQYQRRAA